ncbi:negative cofactor 2 transcription regulator complex subunit BUR6 [Kluyveromyces lactis]|uniref:KLLA0C11935p n=1 Tax=Kluyveromyces lactis (strain ATCC 8585 / CBS 2359 / DSM 70799 / NBRC 1267 / NRRL Y-1140 / WM37) TaxID=284590 RepID=Q6CTK6_KLULA|nr:uncharacterized protein KLLA0_C11935g [Kluyveromyces lactis]CAH01584.1 KLLA0C11935p [Kluyveromyces lactis]|eukprot:XP_452733.1 uncharacterized protein KLLA0_C11935g [Kluyveromyces lactis]
MSEYDSGVSSDERGSSQAPDVGSTAVSSELGNLRENIASGDGVHDNNNGNNGMTVRSRDAEVFDKIKTHFPPAKIKKIMQTDEDIGKVSQATPVITGRSLEFFIALLVDKSSKVARDQGSKRISADIMKKTILTDEKFDFLREVILPQEQ